MKHYRVYHQRLLRLEVQGGGTSLQSKLEAIHAGALGSIPSKERGQSIDTDSFDRAFVDALAESDFRFSMQEIDQLMEASEYS